jgi:hypothetical protein
MRTGGMRDSGELDELLRQRALLEASERGIAQSDTRLSALRLWQAARLARTYDDLRRDPQCADAIGFFLSDLYGLADHTHRDRDLTRAWELLKRTLPQAALEVLGSTLELQVLTAQLDQAMGAEIAPGPISWPLYAAAYRAVGRADARRRQIELVVRIGGDLERLVRHEWLALALRAARSPAQLAGFGALQDFLERGFAAFRKLPDSRRLLAAIQDRETRLSAALSSGAEVPADIAGAPAAAPPMSA